MIFKLRTTACICVYAGFEIRQQMTNAD